MNTIWTVVIVVLAWFVGFMLGYALRRWAEPDRERGLALAVWLLNRGIPGIDKDPIHWTEEMLVEQAREEANEQNKD